MQIPVPDHPVAKRLYELGKKISARDGTLPVVQNGTSEWRAWREWRKEHDLPVDVMDRLEEWTVITAYPPQDLSAFEQEWAIKSKRGRVSDQTAKALEA